MVIGLENIEIRLKALFLNLFFLKSMATKRNYSIFENPKPPAKKNKTDENSKFLNPIKIWTWNVAGLRGLIKVDVKNINIY